MKHEVSDEAEWWLLGAILRYPRNMDEVSLVTQEHHFRHDGNRAIWRAFLSLYQSHQPIDPHHLAVRLKEAGDLDNVGGAPKIGELWCAATSGIHAVAYADLVKSAALLRSLHDCGLRIQHYADSPTGPAVQMVEEAEREVYAIAEHGLSRAAVALSTALGEAADQIDLRATGNAPDLILTGLDGLDRLTAGLHPGELVVIAARPAVGKTALGLALALNVARAGTPVFFASLEQARTELATRLLCAASRVDGNVIRHGALSTEELERLRQAKDSLLGLPVHIDDAPAQTVTRITAQARRLKRRGQASVVFVDYLQLIDAEDRKVPRHEQVGGISRRLKGLARELSVPVVAMAQLNRGVEDRAGQRPRLADLRESGSIEADADTVILLHRPPDRLDLLELLIAKQRSGPTGDHAVRFDRARMCFAEMTDGPF